jgi:hypothetical protein
LSSAFVASWLPLLQYTHKIDEKKQKKKKTKQKKQKKKPC